MYYRLIWLDKLGAGYYLSFTRQSDTLPGHICPGLLSVPITRRDTNTSNRRIQRGFTVHPDWADVLARVRIVLVGATHPGNVGSAARAMKNMALSRLVLVSCVDSGPDSDAYATASGAYEIVQAAERVPDLATALADSVMAVATSGRLGSKRTTGQTPSELAPEMLETAKSGWVSCVFGRESRGLTNEEMKLCTNHLIIPTDASFASMNLAHAVAVIGYELFSLASRPAGFQVRGPKPATVEELEGMYSHIEEILTRARFLDAHDPLRMMRDVRRILNRARMDSRDVKIIRGIFRKMWNMVRLACGEPLGRSNPASRVE